MGKSSTSRLQSQLATVTDRRYSSAGVVHDDHGGEDVLPGFGIFEDFVGEHETVPTDVLHAARGGVLEPLAGALCDIELAVRIIGLAMAAGLVVRAGTVHGAIVLGDVEIKGPRAEGVGHGFVGGPEFFF